MTRRQMVQGFGALAAGSAIPPAGASDAKPESGFKLGDPLPGMLHSMGYMKGIRAGLEA